MMKYSVGALVVLLAALCIVPAAFAVDQAAERAAIEKRIQSYTAAFNAGDAKKLAEHWLPGAVYVNPLSGTQVEGREAIAREFAAIFEQLKGTKLSVDVQAIRFVSPSVAVETGQAKLLSADGTVEQTRYTAIHVKRDGQWYLDRVTEEEVPVVVSQYDHLKDLEWMVGNWVDADEDSRIVTTCQWSRNKNFLIRWFSAYVKDRVDLAGVQIIGWDPAAKQIRSWVFDSDGGFAEGRWTKKGNHWYVTTTGTLPDGGKAASVNVITCVDNNHFRWKSVNRTVDGRLLPNIDEVVVVRVGPTP